jgi:hypothetical protein
LSEAIRVVPGEVPLIAIAGCAALAAVIVRVIQFRREKLSHAEH